MPFESSLIYAPLNLIGCIEVRYLQFFIISFAILIAFSLLPANSLLARINMSLIYISTISNGKENKSHISTLTFQVSPYNICDKW